MIEKSFDEIWSRVLKNECLFEILEKPKEYPSQFIEKLSIEAALMLWDSKASYEDTDCFMNEIFGFWQANFSMVDNMSELTWRCYLAFDEGEYKKVSDDQTTNPIEKYTRPMVKEILKDCKLIS